MKILEEAGDKVLIETDEPILFIQIIIGLWLISIPVSLVIGAINMWTSFDVGIDGHKIFLITMIALGLFTLNGTPCKTKWVDKDLMN